MLELFEFILALLDVRAIKLCEFYDIDLLFSKCKRCKCFYIKNQFLFVCFLFLFFFCLVFMRFFSL